MPFLIANGVRTYYETIGEGPPLLLIAGNGMDHTCFHEQVPQFGRQFRCITYDLRGIGRSDCPPDGYTISEMARDALALLAALDLPSAHVAGYSLGGAIAQEMAISEPARVRTLSLYATYDRPLPYLRLRYDLLIQILLETTPALWAKFTAFSAFGERYIDEHWEEVEREIKRRVARWDGKDTPPKIGLAGHYRAILSHDSTDRLNQILCPTWIAVGDQDPVTPVLYSRRLHERIAGSVLEIFPGCPHRVLNFNADQFNRKALTFLLRHRE